MKFFALISVLIGALATDAVGSSLSMQDLGKKVGLDQRIGSQIPLDAEFLDETGRLVHLRDYFKDKPVVLALVYFECPMLCTLVLNGLVKALKVLTISVGREFEVLAISFDPKEAPALALEKKKNTVDSYRRPESASGWHFLTGSQESIQAITESVGFRYTYDASTKEYAHPGGVMILTPQGQVSRYLYGVEYAPRDLRLTIVEASEGKLGTAVDQLLLMCYRYDPQTGQYTVAVMMVLRIAGLATLLGLVTLVLYYLRKERKNLRA